MIQIRLHGFLIRRLTTFFGSYYDEKRRKIFLHLIKLYSPKTDKRFAEIIKMIYNFFRALCRHRKNGVNHFVKRMRTKTEEHKKILFEKNAKLRSIIR
ncbi:MAG: hypothetical protein L6V93_07500 [Clostridiales bacterium]|nr:MAG: hypothetical protein L6V93_07500 [Clostridiales bacterium]